MVISKRGRKIIYLLFAIEVLAILLYYSIIPLVIPGEPSFMDKIKHFLAYLLLSLLIYGATRNFKIAIFLSIIYGFLMEALQFTVPFRTFSLADILANSLGAGLVYSIRIFRKTPKINFFLN
jgi:VanZ family protein